MRNRTPFQDLTWIVLFSFSSHPTPSRQVRSVEDISSGYSSTEFLDPTSSAVVLAGGGGGVGGVGGGATLRRAGSIRTTRSSVRPASAVLADGYPVRAGGRTSAATSAATLAVSADVRTRSFVAPVFNGRPVMLTR